MIRREQVVLAALVSALAASGCDDKQKTKAGDKKAASTASVSAAPAKPKPPWYVGTWQGKYETQHFLIEMTKKQGAVKNWASDEGEEGAGKGTLSLTISKEKSVQGKASGALGDLEVVGELDEDTLRLRLRPKTPTEASFAGVIIAKRKGEAFEGTIQASSGDSLKVRDAPIKLTKSGAAGDAPAPAGSP